MRRLLGSLLALASLAGAAAAADRAVLEDVKTEWQNLYGIIVYSATARAKNASGTPLPYVKVKLVLRDKDGKVVAEKVGYNLAAEILAAEDGGSRAEKLARVKPIPGGGTDVLRLSLEKEEIGKPFRSAELSIDESD